MSLKNACTIFILISLFLSCSPVASAQMAASPQPSPVDLGDIRGVVVTLYYYDPATGGKGAIVPLPGGQNPQEVEWDANKSAPGTYTFYKVPFGTYYVEAVHNGNAWFAIATVGEGTTTANVAIPLNNTVSWQPVAQVPSGTPTPPPPAATDNATPSSSPSSTPVPGMTTAYALAGLLLVALYAILRGK
jgi:hypothetical protein